MPLFWEVQNGTKTDKKASKWCQIWCQIFGFGVGLRPHSKKLPLLPDFDRKRGYFLVLLLLCVLCAKVEGNHRGHGNLHIIRRNATIQCQHCEYHHDSQLQTLLLKVTELCDAVLEDLQPIRLSLAQLFHRDLIASHLQHFPVAQCPGALLIQHIVAQCSTRSFAVSIMLDHIFRQNLRIIFVDIG